MTSKPAVTDLGIGLSAAARNLWQPGMSGFALLMPNCPVSAPVVRIDSHLPSYVNAISGTALKART